ncbi:hypothetical protein G6F57_023149 [Rhizopus arrhizus]|nr:hypothetical protein G6F57_023149 [Rhizopus arrhizus]
MVVGQFQHARQAGHPQAALGVVFRYHRAGRHVGQEVQAELGLREVALVDQLVAEHAGVEVQRGGDVLHPQHGVVEHEAAGFGRGLGGDAGDIAQGGNGHGGDPSDRAVAGRMSPF